MNTKLVAVQEAFQAMLAGKNILVRSTESTLLTDFRPVSEFAADIWAKTGVEFTIQIDMIELAGIRFTKPLTVDELEADQDVFVVHPSGIIQQYKYQGIAEGLVTFVSSGFAQRDFENAKLQYEAFCKSVGGTPLNANLEIVEQSKKRSRKSTKITEIDETEVDENSASNDVEKKTTFQESVKAAEDHFKYEQKLNDLIERAATAATPVEANALVKYTTDWTEEQRKPLLDAINKRLVELDAQNKTNPQSPPSLMVQIQNAPDLTTLDALEIDVSERHPDIQPKLMGYVRKRRVELEKIESFTPESVIQSLHNAQNIDELNRIMSDPLLETIDQTEISEIYEQRFNDLNG